MAQNHRALAKNLISDYQGKIISIEQLNSSTCWAVLSPMISNYQAVELAESIGYYIRNSTGGIRGQKPSIHVFVSGKHIAIARPYGMKYKGKLDIANWDPSAFGGKYQPYPKQIVVKGRCHKLEYLNPISYIERWGFLV